MKLKYKILLLIDCIVNLLLGIGLALLFELAGQAKRFRGLGLGGAILINIVGSLVLIFWLLFGSLDIPIKGRMVLWIVGVIVFLIGPITMFWVAERTIFETHLARAKGRKLVEAGSVSQVGEPQVSYGSNLDLENDAI